jgi:hypothetical protein
VRCAGVICSAVSCMGTGELHELVYAPHTVLDRASHGWRGLTITPKGLRLLQDLRRQLLQPPAAKEVIGQAVTAAG